MIKKGPVQKTTTVAASNHTGHKTRDSPFTYWPKAIVIFKAPKPKRQVKILDKRFMCNCTAYKKRIMGTLKLIFDFKFPLPPSLFVIKKEPERGAAAAADYKLEIHILATFKTLGGSQIILGRLSILLYIWFGRLDWLCIM